MDRTPDPGLLVQELIYAGLDALRQVHDLDLCAYLHTTSHDGPQLFLATPDLSSIGATEAFNLFTALRDTLDHDHEGDETLLLGQYWATAVTSEGSWSKGLHVFGSRDRAIDNGEQTVLSRLAKALGAVVHRIEAAPTGEQSWAQAPAPTPIRVAVETADAGPRAEVTVAIGEELRTGIAQEPTPLRAVAAAVVQAVDPSLKLLEAIDGDVAAERAVLVLLQSESGRSGLGSALVGQEADPLRAACVAALQATARLASPERRPSRSSTTIFTGGSETSARTPSPEVDRPFR